MNSRSINTLGNQPATLIIRLLAPLVIDQDASALDPEVHCLCYDAKGVLISENRQCLSRCAASAPDAELYLLLALEDVFVSSISVKSKKSSQLLKAAPFMLEEALATGIEDQHFALAKSNANDAHPVIVLSNKKMQDCLELLQSHQLQTSLITVDIFLLPYVYDEYSVLIDYNGRALVRTGPAEGFCCLVSELNALLDDLLDNLPLPPEIIHCVYLDTAMGNESEGLFSDSERLSSRMQPLSSDELFSQLPPLANSAPNLLQGDYLESRNQSAKPNKWRYPVCLLLLWALLVSISSQYDYQQLYKANEQAESDIQQLLREYIDKPVTNLSAEQQLQEHLEGIQVAANIKAGFIELLLRITPDLIGYNPDRSRAVNIKQIIYQDGQLQIFISTAESEMIEALRVQLMSNADQVEIDQFDISDGIASARIRLYE
jgi:type II secretion system protein L